MYGDTERGGAATALRFVTCDLSSLSDCGCMTSADSDLVGSSTKRKTRSSGSHIDPDSFTALSAKRLILGRPTLIDRLISRNKSALEEMEGKKRGPGRPPLSAKNKVDPKEAMKRKRTDSMNGTSPAIKRLRSAKEGSESDSSESRNTSIERRRGRPPLEKSGDKKTSPKKPTRKIERRFSVRIHHSSLRSGKKRKELLALKQRRIRNLAKDAKGKKKWNGLDKTDSNSNVCPENDSNDEIDDSTDSEISRGTSDVSDVTSETKKMEEKQKSPEEDIKKKRKRRKRDSMWVRKVKKQIKAKSENADTSLSSLPSLDKINADEDDEEEEDVSEILETSDIPILDKESDESLILDNSIKVEPVSNNTSAEDVAMPKLEKEVDLPSENNEDLLTVKQDFEVVESENIISLAIVSESEASCSEFVAENNSTDIATEEKNADDSSTEVPSDIPLEEKNPPEDPYLDINIYNLSAEKKADDDTIIYNRETETVHKTENERKELKISCEKNEDTSVLIIEQIIDKCDYTSNENSSDDQSIDTKEDSIMSISTDSMIVTNGELNVSEVTSDFEKIKDGERSDLVNEELYSCKESNILNDKHDEIDKVNEIVNEKCDDVCMESAIGNEKLDDICMESEMLNEKLDDICIESEIVNKKLDNICKESEIVNEKLYDICKESGTVNEKLSVSWEESDVSEVDNKAMEELLENDVSEQTENVIEFNHETSDEMMDSSIEIKEEPQVDADSTSDVKPSLDDSFTDFSLSLPDDLDLDSSLSDEHEDGILEDESDHIFPDSTEETKLHGPKPEDIVSFTPTTEPCQDDQFPVESIPNGASESCDISEEQQKTRELDVAVISNNDENIALSDSQEKTDPKTAEDVLSEIMDKDKTVDTKYEELTNEQRQMKESVLQALGLKSLTPQQPEEKPKRDGYTGTLKAVIKLNRTGDKKRMVYRRSEDSMGELEYRICSEIPATDGVPITHLNDIASIRKNVSNKVHHDSDVPNTASSAPVTSNGHSEDHETNNQDESKGASAGKESNLIIPEKSSSFSIHPGRLCSDVCSYCFGKFGCLDTPCHVAQLKSERQKKILENEPHLTGESCLCDACYRYVDRKANCPSKANATPGTSGGKTKVRPPASSQCCVNHCSLQATHTVKKKWLVKLKKSISNKIQNDKLDIDLDKSAAMYFPLCAQHHYWVDYFTVCGICRKRLNRNHLYTLGSETDRLNLMLAEDGIPARLSDKLFLCKLCRYYSNLRLKYADPGSIPSSGRIFYRDYRRKILMSLDIPVSDSDEEQIKEEKKKGLKKTSTEGVPNTNGAGSSTKSEEGVMSLTNLATLLGDQPEQQARIQVKFGNVNIGRLSNLNIGQGGREEKRPYSDVGLQANLEFQGPAVPDGSWERCVSTIQFDKRTKKLWQDLQKPYGNQSSFLRHLVMLEKYWRAGYLNLTPGADERAAKYLNGVKNRIKAFEGSSEKPSATTAPPVATPPSGNEKKFPLITNTGEIEVTPLKAAQKKVTPPVMVEKKQMTPLDRAKSLVRMIQPTQRFSPPIQRYQVPMYVPYTYPQTQQHQHHHHPQQRPPPLLKIRNKSMPQAYYPTIPPIPGTQNLKPILPKLPRALTVTQVSHGVPAITLNRSGITIEKQSGGSSVMPALPIEKPSISVFREPAPGPP
ncbi:unnamed protein product [Nezara viridula]|uniref:Uncharacterized protein n=1 Tax=Nezara viridula TaxID=85310 RepID=A0A9P0HIZ5_NEZVI|nr:unnamed protein product [Nezara viridula]